MDFTRILQNRTPLIVRCVALTDRHGHDVLAVIAKLSFEVSPTGDASIADAQRPVRSRDEATWFTRNARARWRSVRFASDLVDEKPGTDVMMVGTAWSSAGARTSEVSLRIETGSRTLRKVVRVYGPRVWYKAAFGVEPGPPALLAPTPLVYELTYGGEDDSDSDDVLVDWRNPAGTGVARNRSSLIGQLAPQLEDPEAPLSSRAPAPATFGPIAATWAPRLARGGTYDDDWRRKRAPVRPHDFDPRHHCAGPPDLWSPEPLLGDEPVEVLGASPEGVLRFRLPRIVPSLHAVVRGEVRPLSTHLDTVVVDMDALVVELTWRTRVVLPKKSQMLEAVYATLGEGTDAQLRDQFRRALPLV